MRTHHSTLHTIQRIDFAPDTFTPGDLLWLPHHAELARMGKKRQTEHLAGRIAAVHALRAFDEKSVPGIGKNRQPIWPDGLYGSISHCGNTAIAIVARTPVGIDIEAFFSPQLASELASHIASEEELAVLRHSTLPLPLALTLAFSSKESAFKAYSAQTNGQPGFHSAQVVSLDASTIRLSFTARFAPALANSVISINGLINGPHVITSSLPLNEA